MSPPEPREGRPAAGLHLVEVGLRWPPETFLARRLEGLAARGMRITVGAELIDASPGFAPRGVELCKLPPNDGPFLVRLARAAWAGLRLGLRRPRRLPSLVRAAFRPPPPCVVPAGERLTRFAAWARLARLDPDVAHCEWNGTLVTLLPVLDLWKRPLVASSHGSDVSIYPYTSRRPRALAGLEAAFARADAFHVVCDSLREEVIFLGLDPSRVRVIRNAVDTDSFRPDHHQAENGDELALTCVGGLRWMKGHEFAVRALAIVASRGVPARLTVVGADPDARVGEESQRERIRYVASECGVAGRVELNGKLAHGDIAALLRRSDILLQASLSEGLPVTVLEAMASGVPVVATRCGGVAEAVRDGVEGRVVPPRDPVALADAIEDLWRDPRRRHEMGAAGRRRAVADFGLESQLAGFESLYAELTGNGGPVR